MYFTIRQQAKHLFKEDYCSIGKLCHIAKKLTKQAIYNIRQHYFAEGKYLNCQKNYALLKTSDNYSTLNSDMAQQILKEVGGSFKSFFGLLKQELAIRFIGDLCIISNHFRLQRKLNCLNA